jgi:hypothetical protein
MRLRDFCISFSCQAHLGYFRECCWNRAVGVYCIGMGYCEGMILSFAAECAAEARLPRCAGE